MIKKALLALAIIVAGLVLLTLGMLYSSWGTRVLIGWVDHQIDPLEIEYQSGALASELVLSKVSWQDEHNKVSLNQLQTNMQLGCLIRAKLCVDSLEIDTLITNLQPDTNAAASNKSSNFQIPLAVSLGHFELAKLDVNYADNWRVLATQLTTDLQLDSSAKVKQFTLQNLAVTQLKKTSDKPATAVNATYLQQLQYQPLVLNNWSLPLGFNIEQFDIKQLNYQGIDSELEQVESLHLSANGKGTVITLNQFNASYQYWRLNVAGKITTKGKYPNQFKLNLLENRPNQQTAELQWQAQGDLSAWKHQLSVSGPYVAEASLQVNLLKASLPVALHAAWQELAWPLTSPEWQSKNGILDIDGNLNQFAVSLNSQLEGQNVPSTDLTLNASGNRQQLSIESLQANLLQGQIALTGELLLGQTSKLQADVAIQNIDASHFWPELKSHINGELTLKASSSKQDWQFQLSPIDIHGNWREHALALSGEVNGDKSDGLSFKQLKLQSGDNHLLVDGALDTSQKLQSQIVLDAGDLSQIWPGLAGTATLNSKVDGELSQPHAMFSVNANGLKFDEWQLARLQGDGELTWDNVKPVDVTLTVEDITSLNHQLELGRINLQGNAAEHILDIQLKGDGAGFNAKLAGAYLDHGWKGQWQSGEILSKYAELTLLEPFSIDADWQENQYVIGANCWKHQKSSLCISNANYSKQQADWSLQVKQLPIAPILNRFVSQIPQVDTSSELNLDMQGHWDGKSLPNIAMQLQLSGDEWRFNNKNALALNLDPTTVDISMDQGVMKINSQLSGKQIGQFDTNLTITPQGEDKLLGGEVGFKQFDLHPFINLAPQLDTLAGVMQGKVALSGSLSAPQLTGSIKLHEGAISGNAIPVVATAIEQTLELKGQYADINGTYKLGSGNGNIQGQLHWLPEVKADLSITGSDLELVYQNVLRGTLTPDIQIAYSLQKIDISGRIQIPYARVRLKELPESAVSPSDDVVMIDEPQVQSSVAQKLNLDLLVQIDPKRTKDVKLDAFGLTTDLQGELKLAQASDNLLADGEVTLINGRYRAYGQNLLIKEGELIFHGPVSQPHVALEAIRDPSLTADDVTAGIRVNGSAKAPTVSVFSDPVMEQPQALSYLLRGRGLNSANDQGQDAMLTTMLLGLGLSRSENLVGHVGHKLGVKDLTLDTSGQGDNTQLALTGYIAPGVQLRYGLGVFNSASEVALRYELTPKLYLEAVSGLSNALDLYYSFSVGEDEQEAESSKKH